MESMEPFDVTLANLDVTEVTVFETTLVATIRVTNPNPEAYVIEGASFKLYLEGKKVGTGTANQTFTVDRLDSSLVDVLFHINNASALLRLREFFEAEGQTIDYGVRGILYTEGTWGTTKLKVEKTGRIDLSRDASSQIDPASITNPPPRHGINP